MRFPSWRREAASRGPGRTRHLLRTALAGLVTLTALCLATLAQAGVTTQFNYSLTNGGMPIYPELPQKFNQYGDTGILDGINAPDAWYLSKMLVAAPPANSYGAFYYKTPVDMTEGFQTKFLMKQVTGGFSFIIKNPKTAARMGSGEFGYDGIKNAVAITFNNIFNTARLSVPNESGELQWLNDFVAVDYNPQLSPTDSFQLYGEVLIRYVPKSKLLDVYHWQPTAGNPSLVFRATNFDLNDYGVLDNGTAEIGVIGRGHQPTETHIAQTRMDAWQFGNNLQFDGITSTAYTELMTFKTSNQPVWGSKGKVEWNHFLGVKGSKSFDESFYFPSDLKTFGAGVRGDVAWDDGLIFEASADGGLVNINYPLKLRLAFPMQRAVDAGQEIPLIASFEPDFGATMTTSSPKARFRSYFNFKNSIDTDFMYKLPIVGERTETILDVSTNVDKVKFIDTDVIWERRQEFGLAASATGGLISIQDGEGANGPSSNRRGSSGGSTKGASKGSRPTDFISLNIQVPSLNVNGGLNFSSTPGRLATDLVGGTSSKFLGLHADFTSALMGLTPVGRLLPLNQDFEYRDYSVGWHIADLYGDVNLNMNVAYQFKPKPQLRLYYDDGTWPKGSKWVDVLLDPEGQPVPVHGIRMTERPMVFTPVVTMPNTFSPSAGLTLGGSLGFNPFQIYVNVPPDVSLDTNPAVIQPFTLPLGKPAQVASTSPTPFQLSGFNTVTGKAYTLFPKRSTNPIIHSATPDSALITAPNQSGSVNVTLECEGADPDVWVIWNDDPSTVVVPAAKRLKPSSATGKQVVVSVPLSFLSSRGVNTLTLINGIDEATEYRSNAATFSAVPAAPAVTSVAPNSIQLTDPPQNSAGTPILKVDANGDGAPYFTVTVKGTNFVPDVTLAGGNVLVGTVVQWNGQALPTTFVDGNTLTAKVPGSYIEQASTANVQAVTSAPGGGISSGVEVSISNPTPTLTAVSPNAVGGTGSTTLNLTGTSFVPGSTVTLTQGGSSVAPPTTFIGSSRLDAQVSLGSLTDGTYVLMVTNPAPGGGSSNLLQVRVDKTAPSTTATSSPAASPGGWNKGDVTVTLTATDGASGSGVKSLIYQVGSADPVIVSGASATVTLTAEGTHPIGYSAVDHAGNQSAFQTLTVKVDKSAPITQVTAAPAANAAGWNQGTVTVTLAAADSLSGVAGTHYTVDGGAPRIYTSPFQVFGEGIHTVQYWSVDEAGNTEAAHSTAVRIDGTRPATTASPAPAANANDWYPSAVTVTLAPTDNLSGVGKTFYTVDGGAQQEYVSPFTVSGDAVHTVAFWSVDVAGNVEAAKQLTLRIDGTRPTLTASANKTQLWPANGKLVPVTVTGRLTDNGSGLQTGTAAYQVVDEYGKVQPAGSLQLKPDGTFSFTIQLEASRTGQDKDGRLYQILLQVKDAAGNLGTKMLRVVVPHNQRK